MKKNNTVMLVGGGTGGHAAPILAIFQNLSKREPNLKIHVVGVGSGEEKYFFSKISNYHTIKSGKLHRYLTLKNLAEATKFVSGIVESMILIKKIKPKVIFSKGGHVSLPVITAAKFLKVPYFIHESDIEMGKTNKMMSGSAKKVFVSFPLKYYPGIESDKIIWTGPVLRADDSVSKPSRSYFGFDNDKPVIFLTGGSQGSLVLTTALIGVMDKLLLKYDLIHQAGKHSIEVSKQFESTLNETDRKSYYLAEFLANENGIDMMWEAIKAADLVVTRAGSTIAEVAVLKKPMILIPWKHAAQNHQLKNANYLVDNGAASMINEDDLSPELLLEKIEANFSSNKDHTSSYKELFPSDGVKVICDNIIKEIEDK
jgi:UDP-N-acetylglucosamine--N-acetylmuramyl-(pentapeptide) pyrophosphoryl-undecaprenol N-acetylglucosamine transferase